MNKGCEMKVDMAWLAQVKCFLMDMDGTIFLGDHLLPGAQEWLSLLENRGVPYYFLTNNSSRSRVEYAEKLNRLGLTVSEDHIFTSGEATAIYLRKSSPDARLYVVGTASLHQEFTRWGFTLVEDDPDAAVLGFDTTLTYEKLWKLCDLVSAGVPYIATHPDLNCPTEDGFKPDIGAMIAFVAASTGRQPDAIIGKPNAPIVEALAAKTGFPIQTHCMVGDRLYTDIALGQWGVPTVLVLSGETKKKDLAGSVYKPDLVVKDVAALITIYQGVFK